MPRILIFEDNENFRQSLQLLLAKEPSYSVVGSYDNCISAYAIVQLYKPDVVLMDIDMPGMSGIKGVRLVKEAKPDTQIIMHTVFEDDENLFASFCAGADGYLLKKHSLTKLIAAIGDVLSGGAPLSAGIARRVLAHFQKPLAPAPSYSLTAREKEILTWLIKGYSYKMIAATCKLSTETVKSHLKNIYAKLHVSCGTEAVAKALQENIV